jgi:hypothetical protein
LADISQVIPTSAERVSGETARNRSASLRGALERLEGNGELELKELFDPFAAPVSGGFNIATCAYSGGALQLLLRLVNSFTRDAAG